MNEIQNVLKKYEDIHKAICKVFGDMDSFLKEYNNGKHDFQSMIYDEFREKLFDVEIYFHKYKGDEPKNILSDDEAEEYDKYMQSYFKEELNYFIYDYKKLKGLMI